MKDYFINFDYWNSNCDRYYCGIVKIDLTIPLDETCKRLIKESLPNNEEYGDFQIRINAINNINT